MQTEHLFVFETNEKSGQPKFLALHIPIDYKKTGYYAEHVKHIEASTGDPPGLQVAHYGSHAMHYFCLMLLETV